MYTALPVCIGLLLINPILYLLCMVPEIYVGAHTPLAHPNRDISELLCRVVLKKLSWYLCLVLLPTLRRRLLSDINKTPSAFEMGGSLLHSAAGWFWPENAEYGKPWGFDRGG